MADLVQYERRGAIGVITVNNPPVNALSQGVRQGLADALAKGIADEGARALVLIGGGRTFIAGADIREFGKPPMPPDLNAVIAQYEGSPKLVVAAIHGTAFGGGLELAMAFHYRVAVSSAQVGQPEVRRRLEGVVIPHDGERHAEHRHSLPASAVVHPRTPGAGLRPARCRRPGPGPPGCWR